MSSNKVLFIFKDRKSVTLNNDFWSEKFKHKFQVSTFFLNDNLDLSNKEITLKINNIISQNDIEILLFEGDHAHIIDYDFIKRLKNNVKKGIFLGDDMVWHHLNLVTSQSCDFVFSSCPLSALKFQEIGIRSFFVPIECNGEILKDYKFKKIYDVLHFGREKTNRNRYVKFLEQNNIKVKSVNPYDKEADTFEKLAKLINQSKIVLNFSESSNGNRKFNPLRIYKSFYQLKGRIQMAGISNVLCLTEYNPSIYIMYKEDELPSFKSEDECLEKIRFFLNNKDKLDEFTKRFNQKSLVYEDSNYIHKIDDFLKKIDIKEKFYFSTPYWYKYIFINQTMRLRFKRIFIKTFFKEFFDNITNFDKKNFLEYLFTLLMTLFVFLRYLPFLLIKPINRLLKK